MSRACAIIVLFLLLVAPMTFISNTFTDTQQFEDRSAEHPHFSQSQPIAIQGQSFLNITGPIIPSSPLSATWFAEIVIPESMGTDLLENQSLGLREQIDLNLGNSDGWIDSAESSSFAEIVESSRNWTDGAAGGCCLFDYVPFVALDGNEVFVNPPAIGAVNNSNGSWGWTESSSLSGATDGRTVRVIDLPMFGSLVERLPLTISLPEDWEIRFSPMIEIISGDPRNFTVNRSEAPVVFDIRITIAQNNPPSISSSRFPPTTSTIPLAKISSFSAECKDGPLESPSIQWSVSREETPIATFLNPWFELTPSELGFSHGDVASVAATCTDFHGMASISYDNVTVDGLEPTWSGSIILLQSGANQTIHDLNDSVIEISAGSELIFEVNGTDDSGLPVAIELFTNISEGWRQFGTNQETFWFIVNQGLGINGAHISIDERHQSKDPTILRMLLQISDDARNYASQEWQIRVLDANPPTVMMDLIANGITLEIDDSVHENDQIQLSFSRSFDDLDSIEDLVWSVTLDGASLISDGNWASTEILNLSQLPQGEHEVVVSSTDSSGNTRTESFVFTVLPKSGAHLVVLEKSLSGGTEIGSTATISTLVHNEGTDPAYARICMDGNCSRYVEFPGATLEGGTTSSTIELEFVIQSPDLQGLRLEWDSTAAGTNGEIQLEYPIASGGGADQAIQLTVLAAIAVLLMAAIYRSRES